jgi:RalA-binding protein 1
MRISPSGSMPNLLASSLPQTPSDRASRQVNQMRSNNDLSQSFSATIPEDNNQTPRPNAQSQPYRNSVLPSSRLGPSRSTQPSTSPTMSNSSSTVSSTLNSHDERNGAVSPEKGGGVGEGLARGFKDMMKISAPQGGAPIPAGFKFGAKDEVSGEPKDRDRKAKSGRWGFGGFGKISQSFFSPYLLIPRFLKRCVSANVD